MKNYIFYLLIILTLNLNLHSQSSFCGEVSPNQATSNHPDSIRYDRFGNTYDIYPQGQSFPGQTNFFSTGYFDVTVDMAFTLAEIEILEAVFNDAALLIPQRTLLDNCGDPIPNTNLNITIENASLASNVLAAATPMYEFAFGNDCQPMTYSTAYQKINGGRDEAGNDGIIEIDLSKRNLMGFTYPNQAATGVTDFYSIVLHEIMHIIGFDSRITESGALNGYFSQYDLLLNGQNQLIDNNCDDNCFDIDYINFINGNTVASCGVAVGNSGAFTTSGSIVDNLQTLSHLEDSSNCGDDHYLMNSTIMSGHREMMHPEELAILCEQGYQIPGMNCPCNIIAEQNIPIGFPQFYSSCCPNIFYSCSDTYTLNVSDLLCFVQSDQLNGNVTDVWALSPLSTATLENDIVTLNYVSGGTTALFGFSYSLDENCNCKSYNSLFLVVFDSPNCQQNNCEFNDPCSNLLCVSDFEGYRTGFTNLGHPFYFENLPPQNSPDIVNDDNNTFISVSFSEEAFALQINGNNRQECDYTLSFEVIDWFGNSGFEIWIANSIPCTPNDIRIGENCPSSTTCTVPSNYIFQSECLASYNNITPGTYNVPIIFTNHSIDINYLIFKGNNRVNLDNFSLTKQCATNPSFTSTQIDCNNFTFAPNTNANVDYTWEISSNNIVIETIPMSNLTDGILQNYSFPNDGDFEVRLTVIDECGFASSSEQSFNIACITQVNACGEIVHFLLDADENNSLSYWINELNIPFVTQNIGGVQTRVISNLMIAITGNRIMFDIPVEFRNCTFFTEKQIRCLANMTAHNTSFLPCGNNWDRISLAEDINISILGNSLIEDANTAISADRNNNVIVDNSIIRNINTIAITGSVMTTTISNTLFEDCKTILNHTSCDIVVFKNNEAQNCEKGIKLRGADYANIEANIINTEYTTLELTRGVYDIVGNILDCTIQGLYDWNSTIHLSTSTATIENNFINRHGLGTGIHTEAMRGNVIIDNNDINGGGYIGYLTFPVVSLSGNESGNELMDNVVNANSSQGFYLLNSSDAIMECNNITSSQGTVFSSGVWNNTNSDRAYLKGNEFDSYRDLFTRSTIIDPIHTGNCFNGNRVEGQFNSQSDFDESTFFVDQMDDPCLLPSLIIPNNWFVDEQGETQGCSSPPGPNPEPFLEDTPRICAFLNQLVESYQDPDQQLLSINRLLSLFRAINNSDYYKNHPLPDCMNTFLDSTSLCGIQLLLSSDSLLNEAIIGSDTINFQIKFQTTITFLVLQTWLNYDISVEGNTQEEKNVLWANYLLELSSLRQLTTIKETTEDMAWSSLDSIPVLECMDSISIIEMKAIKLMAKAESLTEAEELEIDFFSKKCAQTYGRGVHLMRSLASEINSIDYREYDLECESESGLSNSKSLSTSVNDIISDNELSITPNPNNGDFSVHYNGQKNMSNLSIYNLQGQLIQLIENVKNDILIISKLSSGIYILKCSFDDGSVVAKQFVIK